MATISNTPRPGYIWDATDNVWYPIGVGAHQHTNAADTPAVIPKALVDAKGDLLTATADNTPARLAVGANNTVLTADSSTATGLKWATAGASVATPTASGTVFGETTSTVTDPVSIGYNALVANTTGENNTAVGASALKSVTDGFGNVAVGTQAMENSTGFNSVAIGKRALRASTGGNNIAINNNALVALTSGESNTAVGANALEALTTGNNNTAIGNYSQVGHNGSTNTSVGSYAMESTTGTLQGTTSIGHGTLTNVTGSNNTALGLSAGNTVTTGANNTLIGNAAQASSATVSNTITLGNSSISTLRCQVTSITALSDERDKKNIEPLNVGLDFVNSLKPVIFDWNMRTTVDKDGNEIAGGKVDVPDTGFIAQDFVEVEDAIGLADHLQLTYRDNPDALEITQGRLIPILVKAIQDLSANNQVLVARIEVLEGGN